MRLAIGVALFGTAAFVGGLWWVLKVTVGWQLASGSTLLVVGGTSLAVALLVDVERLRRTRRRR